MTDWTGLPARALAALIGPERSDEVAFLPAALEVSETPPSPVGRVVGYTIVTFFVCAIAWSVLGKVDIIATANGSVMPLGLVKVVQTSGTGVVRAIRVEDGAHVRKGDVLIELDPTLAAADDSRMGHDALQARLDVARLRALADGTPFVAPPGAPADAVAEARAATAAQGAEQAAHIADLDGEIRQKDGEVAEVAASTTQLRAVLPMLEQKHQIRQSLQEQGFGSTFALLDAEQQLTESRQELAVLAQKAAQARAARAALVGQRGVAVSGFRSKVLADLAAAQQRDAELTQDAIKARKGLDQTTLRAPVDGVVEQLAVHTVGAVVTPAQRLLVVVPDDHGMLVEATLANRDVGFVHVGQPVKVKVDAFNYTRYGFITGHVRDVSRNAVTRADTPPGDPGSAAEVAASGAERPGAPSYVVRIALDSTSLDVEGRARPLVPGMTATAEIQTGRRTIIAYLLSPLARRTSESMTER